MDSARLLSYDAMGAHFGQPGYETDLLYIAGLLALCVGGAGPLSLDGYLTARKIDCDTSDERSLRRRNRLGRQPQASLHADLVLQRRQDV